jgi:Methyltransferase domain
MASKFRKFADGPGFLTLLLNLGRVRKGYQPIFLDHTVEAVPRYGHGKPDHPELTALFAKGDAEYALALRSFLQFAEELKRIPLHAVSGSTEPNWANPWFSGLDLVALYGFVASSHPAQLIEVGSGQSTKIARLAIRNHKLKTRITSIDPQPRAEIDTICDEVIRKRLEDCDLSILQALRAGDIFFLDGSHRTFMNSDVTVFFLEILPRMKPGVLVQIHDIFLPQDYLPWTKQEFYPHRYWSEQYMLAASLLAGHSNYDVVLPNHYVGNKPELANVLAPLWESPALKAAPRSGVSFWIRTK